MYNLTERDYELLSAYIDGELPDSERSALERRLQEEDSLRHELVALRQTVTLISRLPTLHAPRDFVLNASMVEQHPRLLRKPPPKFRLSRVPSPSMISAIAAVFVVVFAGVVMLLMGPAVGNTFSNIVAALDTGDGRTSSEQVAYVSTPVPPTDDAFERESAQPPEPAIVQQQTTASPDTGYDTSDDESASNAADVMGEVTDLAADDAGAPGMIDEATEGEGLYAPESSTGMYAQEEAMQQPAAPVDAFAEPSTGGDAPPETIPSPSFTSTESITPTEPPDLRAIGSAESTESPESFMGLEGEPTEVALGNGRDWREDDSVGAADEVEEDHQPDKGLSASIVPVLIAGSAAVVLVGVIIVIRIRHG